MNRLIAIENIRNKINQGGYSIGSWMQIPHSSIAEIMGQSGFDWVAIDMEHGSVGISQLPDLFRAIELGGTLPLARLAEGVPKDCKQALDAGAGGVIVPMIESADQLEAVKSACRWPPSGNRGIGYSRANLYGKNFDEYYVEAQAPLLVAMIEHVRAVENLGEIASVEGLDAILIGPYDLSASMGIPGQFTNPEFTSMMDRIKNVIMLSPTVAGLHIIEPHRNQVEQRLQEGFRFLAYSVDALMLRSGSE